MLEAVVCKQERQKRCKAVSGCRFRTGGGGSHLHFTISSNKDLNGVLLYKKILEIKLSRLP